MYPQHATSISNGLSTQNFILSLKSSDKDGNGVTRDEIAGKVAQMDSAMAWFTSVCPNKPIDPQFLQMRASLMEMAGNNSVFNTFSKGGVAGIIDDTDFAAIASTAQTDGNASNFSSVDYNALAAMSANSAAYNTPFNGGDAAPPAENGIVNQLQQQISNLMARIENLTKGNNNNNPPAAPPPPPPKERQDINRLSNQTNFNKCDTNGNGILEKNELSRFLGSSSEITANEQVLMFATIQSGNEAWHGLSMADVNNLKTRMNNGETMDEIVTSLRTKYAKERRVKNTESDFKKYVERMRNAYKI